MNTKLAVSQILSAMPAEWTGTTFKNDRLLGREGFAQNLLNLLTRKEESGDCIHTTDLEGLDNAEDYLRVASNVATTLEVFLGIEKGFMIEQVFTFSSNIMPLVAVILTSTLPVHLYIGDETTTQFTSEHVKLWELFGAKLLIQPGAPEPQTNGIVLTTSLNVISNNTVGVDGIIVDNVLYISNTSRIHSSDILLIRKRLATPITTPTAIQMLKQLADLPFEEIKTPSISDEKEFLGHLQTLSGTAINPNAYPVVFTAGLPSTASLWISLASKGGSEVLMASTAYGGSSQLLDVLSSRSELLRKHTFDIQGVQANIVERIQQSLDRILNNYGSTLLPHFVLFVETPTNPDMKVPDIQQLALMVQAFINKTGKQVLLLIDTTFAPGSQVMEKIRQLAPELPVMTFISLSKSVSRGVTTAGALVANHTEFAIALLSAVRDTSKLLDTCVKPDQLQLLIENHNQVELRCQQAYQVAAAVGERLCSIVKKVCSYDMPLAFPTKDQAAQGFTSSTFSFNLPPLRSGSNEDNAALAQKFVDLLCSHLEFKPCVSFGQDNGLVYATVPATSTQGAIKEEDKAKQAVGGVQLVRLSFAPTVDVERVSQIIEDAILTIYL